MVPPLLRRGLGCPGVRPAGAPAALRHHHPGDWPPLRVENISLSSATDFLSMKSDANFPVLAEEVLAPRGASWSPTREPSTLPRAWLSRLSGSLYRARLQASKPENPDAGLQDEERSLQGHQPTPLAQTLLEHSDISSAKRSKAAGAQSLKLLPFLSLRGHGDSSPRVC